MLANLDKSKYVVPEVFMFERCRELFKDPEVTSQEEMEMELKWKKPDEEALIKFLVEDKGFAPERVAAGIKRIHATKSKTTQGRLDSFFKTSHTVSSSKAKPVIAKGKGKAKKVKKAGPYANR
jgi:flap endonuclease-1